MIQSTDSVHAGLDPGTFRRRAPLTERFWRRVLKTLGCWEWIGCRSLCGYGRLNVGGRPAPAHRVAWSLTHGPIPDGLFVCHACDNPACVRPDHLFLGTHADNMRDMAKKGRHHDQRGEAGPRARLSDADVDDIRSLYAGGGVTQTDLARRFGVSSSHVSHLVGGYGRLPTSAAAGAPILGPVIPTMPLVGAGA